MSCIFCEIIQGNIPSNKIWEDERTVAFLDVHPINPGHVLVLPKTHEPDFHKLPEEDYLALMKAVKKVAEMIETKINPKRVGLLAAGWDVPHTHLHVVPMYEYHDLTSKRLLEGEPSNPTTEELQKIQEQLINN
jgi:histidine triad (HIT) family protein